jgi:hypothetical protein
MNDDPYADPKQHRATPEMLAGSVPKKLQRQRRHFVKVPWKWVERLAKARHIATYRVAHHVLYRHWKGGGEVGRRLSLVSITERHLPGKVSPTKGPWESLKPYAIFEHEFQAVKVVWGKCLPMLF